MALLGAPNAGKSTLLNTIVGAKVSIVTPKVQTTRMRILGVSIVGDAQLVFIDTPGIFTPKRRLDRAMAAAAWGGASDSDVILLLIDAKTASIAILAHHKWAEGNNRPAVCVLNKIDTVKRSSLLALTDNLVSENIFTDFFMISALNGDGVEDLRCELAGRLPEGPWHFPKISFRI